MQISRFEVQNDFMKVPFLVLKDSSCSMGSGSVRKFSFRFLCENFYSGKSLLTDTGKRINSLPKTWRLRIWGALWRWGPLKTSFETFLYFKYSICNLTWRRMCNLIEKYKYFPTYRVLFRVFMFQSRTDRFSSSDYRSRQDGNCCSDRYS